MPMDPQAETVISVLRNVPQFAQGVVRDLRVRWALEEIGRPYRTEVLDAMARRPDDYRRWQPFGQVPAFADGAARLFESGAILLHLGEQDERLLPRGGQARADALSWMMAALSSLEPAVIHLDIIDLFQAGKPWTREARPSAIDFARSRAETVARALAGKDWIAGDFSIADIMLVTVLRDLNRTDIVSALPVLAQYVRRGEARPAFARALADQLEQLGPPAKFEMPG